VPVCLNMWSIFNVARIDASARQMAASLLTEVRGTCAGAPHRLAGFVAASGTIGWSTRSSRTIERGPNLDPMPVSPGEPDANAAIGLGDRLGLFVPALLPKKPRRLPNSS
jgi:hypothetical protein